MSAVMINPWLNDAVASVTNGCCIKTLRKRVRFGFIRGVQLGRWDARHTFCLEGRGHYGDGHEAKSLRIFYSGYVQGVGFRYTVKSVAAGFEVDGHRAKPVGRLCRVGR